MKKISVIIVSLFLLSITSVYSQTNYDQSSIDKIGQKVLTSNKLPKEVTFKIVESDEVNAYADADNQIIVYTGLIKLIENDDELAGILSHEVGHIMKCHCYKQTFLNLILSYFSSIIITQNRHDTWIALFKF